VTAILILFEMTGDYNIILPLMLTTVVATLIARLLSRESIYTLKLTRRGVHLEQGQDMDVMQGVTVHEAMTTDIDVVPPEMPLPELAQEFARTHHHGFPVVDGAGDLVGVVGIRDLEQALSAGSIDDKTVMDIATTEGLLLAYPEEPMWKALKRLGTRDVSRLPVVREEGSRQLVGVIRRRDIVRAYNNAIVKQAHHQHRLATLRLGRLDDARFVQIDIPEDGPVAGQRVSQISLPAHCLIVSVRRGRRLHIAHGDTQLQAGDQVTVLTGDECLHKVQEQLTGRR
jgi:CIC family chloride channel protein